MKTGYEVLDAINALERRFPVGEWRSDDIDLWPTYRIRLYGNAIDRILLKAPPKSPSQKLRELSGRAARALWRVPIAAARDRTQNARVRDGMSAVFLSDGVSFVRLGGKWFDRVVDPVMQSLLDRGHDCLKLTPLAEVHTPRHVPSIFVQPTIDRIKLIAPRRESSVTAPGFEALRAAASEVFRGSVPTFPWLQVQAARLGALARWFGELLARAGASHAFVNTYYSLEGLAFVQAARRAGIVTIDLQHGMHGAHHVAYSNWVAMPPRGYSTLPNEFWVWGAKEAEAIAAWNRSCTTHSARVTGNFWLERWLAAADPMVTSCLAQARSHRAPSPACTQALVCLTWGVSEEETDKIIDAAKLCGPSVGWWWRVHPAQASRHAEFARRLERHGLDGSKVETATGLPLYALLRAADVVVAHSSTVIQEAADLGVRSVVTSDYGAGLHARLVRTGTAQHATDVRGIVEAVSSLAARSHSIRETPEARRDLLAAAVDSLSLRAPLGAIHPGAV